MNRDWLRKCFYVAEKLYCVYPYEVLEQLYGVGEKGDLNKDEAIAFVEESDPIITEYVDATYPTFEDLGYQEPGFFRPVLMDNYDDEDEKYNYIHAAYGIGRPVPVIGFSELDVEELLKEQGDRPFYIPSKDEINRIVETGLNGNKYYDRLKKMIRKGLNASEYISSIWQHFSVGVDYNDELNFIFPNLEIETSIVDGKKVLDISIEELNEINSHIVECYNHTNRMGSRGWEPIKLMAFLNGGNPRPSKPDIIIPLSEAAAKQAKEAEGYLNSMGVNVDYDAGFGKYNTIVDGKIKRVKVGRNDLCPCGSGKKYKNCHGRGEK